MKRGQDHHLDFDLDVERGNMAPHTTCLDHFLDHTTVFISRTNKPPSPPIHSVAPASPSSAASDPRTPLDTGCVSLRQRPGAQDVVCLAQIRACTAHGHRTSSVHYPRPVSAPRRTSPAFTDAPARPMNVKYSAPVSFGICHHFHYRIICFPSPRLWERTSRFVARSLTILLRTVTARLVCKP